MFCEKCGAQLGDSAKFCTVCGQVVANQQSAEPIQQTQQYDNTENINNANIGEFGNNTGFANDNLGNNDNTTYLNDGFNNASNNLTGNQGFNDANNNLTGNQGFNNGFDNFAYNNQGFNNNGFNNNTMNNPGYTDMGQPSPMPKAKKSRAFIGIAVTLVIVGALVGLFFGVIKPLIAGSTPVNKTLTAVGKLNDYDAIDMTTKIKLKADGMQGAIFDDLAFVINTKGNQKSKTGSFDIGVTFKDSSIATINAYYDEKVVILRSEELFEDTLYVNIEDLKDLLEEANLEDIAGSANSINTEAYKKFGEDLVKDKNFKAVQDNYEKFLKKNLNDFIKSKGKVDVKVVEGGKEKTIKCEELTLTVNKEFVSKVVLGLAKEVSEDKNLKALVKEKLPELIDLANENGVLEAANFDMDEYEEFMENFDKNWDDAMKELKSNLEGNTVKENIEKMNFNYEVGLKIDDKNRLRQFVFDIDMGNMGNAITTSQSKLGISIEGTFNAFDKDVVINKPSIDGAVNLAEMDEMEMISLIGEIQENLQKVLADEFNFGF